MSAAQTPPADGQVPVSALFRQRQAERERQGREGQAERDLLAAWRRLNTPFVVAWEAASDRLREERLMGMHPPMRRVSIAELAAMPLGEMAAADGAHVVIEGDDGPAAVMVSAEEYDRLRVDKRLLRWERTDG
jgi:hypothetical protein